MKKKIEDIPTLEEEDFEEDSDEDVETEPAEEAEEPKQEGKLQIVTNEQLIQFKLDNLSSQVQQTDSRLQELVEHTKKLVEVLRKRK